LNDRAPADVAGRLTQFPDGPVRGRYEGRKYFATKTTFAAERSVKLVAEELGGTDYISLNLYRLAAGPRLRPCEMPKEKVIAFVMGFVPDQPDQDEA
jgi:hypothetical protein